jgi:tetratricopeptide (TPR) repeat protein
MDCLVCDGLAVGYARIRRDHIKVGEWIQKPDRLPSAYLQEILRRMRELNPQGDHALVLEFAAEARKIEPLPFWSYSRLSGALLAKGSPDEARKMLDHVWGSETEKQSLSFDDWMCVGDTEQALGRVEKANQAYKAATDACNRENSIEKLR